MLRFSTFALTLRYIVWLACAVGILVLAGWGQALSVDEPTGPSKQTAPQPRSPVSGRQTTPDPDAEDTRIVPTNPTKPDWLDLGGTKQRIWLVPDMGKSWLLPVYLIKGAKVEPARMNLGLTATLTVHDVFNDPHLPDALEQAVSSRLKGQSWELAQPKDGKVEVTLWADVRGEHRPVGASRFTRASEKATHELEFDMFPDAARLVTSNDLKKLGVTFAETYAVRFTTTDLDATLSSTKQTSMDFSNLISPDHRGRKPVLFVAYGGGVYNKQAVRQLFRNSIRLRFSQRQGAEISPALLESVLTKLFAGLEEPEKLKKEQDNTVVAFLLSSGIKVTSTIGELKKIVDNIKEEVKRRRKMSDDEKRRYKDEIEAKAKVEASFLGLASISTEGFYPSVRMQIWQNRPVSYLFR